MNAIRGVDHVTLRCAPAQLPSVQAFYERVIGLRAGPRPPFDFPGAWLYAGDVALVHLAAVLDAPIRTASAIASSRPAAGEATGYIDHFALRIDAAVPDFRARLRDSGVPYAEAPVPGLPLHQIFVVDPLGVKVELNFVVEQTAPMAGREDR
ncbi:MAG: extradiol dioxygenase [Burkholderiaceae bacterium]